MSSLSTTACSLTLGIIELLTQTLGTVATFTEAQRYCRCFQTCFRTVLSPPKMWLQSMFWHTAFQGQRILHSMKLVLVTVIKWPLILVFKFKSLNFLFHCNMQTSNQCYQWFWHINNGLLFRKTAAPYVALISMRNNWKMLLPSLNHT